MVSIINAAGLQDSAEAGRLLDTIEYHIDGDALVIGAPERARLSIRNNVCQHHVPLYNTMK